MNPTDAASTAVFYLSRLSPRGREEQQELLQVIQALSSFSNTGKHVYTNKSITPVS